MSYQVSNFLSEDQITGTTADNIEHECLRILPLVLDNEASAQEKDYFYKHYSGFSKVSEAYHNEKSLRHLLRSKVDNIPAPQELVSNIRGKIMR